MSTDFELTITKTIPASAKDVFEAWLTPDALRQFVKPMPGMADCDVEVDAKVGGAFKIVMKAGDTEIPHRGEYKVIDRYKTLAFTWLSEYTVPDSTVTLSFKELSDKETELTLHHVGFSNQEHCDNHQQGWGNIVDQLAARLS